MMKTKAVACKIPRQVSLHVESRWHEQGAYQLSERLQTRLYLHAVSPATSGLSNGGCNVSGAVAIQTFESFWKVRRMTARRESVPMNEMTFF